MGTFETTYRKKLLSILRTHDLEESSERARRTIEGVVSRPFEVETPSEVGPTDLTLWWTLLLSTFRFAPARSLSYRRRDMGVFAIRRRRPR
jgi:hypothetical protein